MKPELSKITQALEEILAWVNAAKDFVGVQAPLVVQEILKVGRMTAIIHCLVAIAIISGVYYASRRAKKAREWLEDEAMYEPAWVGICCGYVIGALWFCLALYNLLYVLLAPRLYVIEQIAVTIKTIL